MVSEWMEDGNISDFIRKNPNVNRNELVSPVVELDWSFTDLLSSSISQRAWNICMTSTWSMEI